MKFLSLILLSSLVFAPISSFAEQCAYQFDLDNSKVMAKGFKFTEKTGVEAEFKNFYLEKNKAASSIEELLTGLAITVDLKSIDSKNAARDINLKQTLLNGLAGGPMATVRLSKLAKNTLMGDLTLNGKTQSIAFSYNTSTDGVIIANGSFDALNFTMYSQLSSLKNRCNELHKGKDGKSVTWSTFDLKVRAVIKKSCK